MVATIDIVLDKTTVVSGELIHVTGTWDFGGLPPTPRVACYQSIPVWKVIYNDQSPANTGTFEFDWRAPVVSMDTPGYLYAILQNYGADIILAEDTEHFTVVPVSTSPVITSISTKDPPKLCEPIQFLNTIEWNDDDWKSGDPGTGLRKTVGWEYTTSSGEYLTDTCGDELPWVLFSTEDWPEHIFTEAEAGIKHIRCIVENRYGTRACAMIENFMMAVTNGFTITVDPALAGKPLIVWHAQQMPHTDLWFSAFSWVRGTWNSADPNTVYKLETGDIRETATPPLNEIALGTLFDGNIRDYYDCVILARDSTTLMEFGFFEKADVFKIHSDSPTCVNLFTASNDVMTEAVMGPVCDFFGVSRGTECEAFWAEFSDAVFIANYVSILETGKDTLGNERELSVFEHLALPFAVLGVVAPQIPFGRFISKGLEGLWMGGRKFTDAAYNWMKTVTINVPPSMHIEKDTLNFMEVIVRLNPDAHIDEVMSMIADGHYDDALSRIKQYLPTDFGSVDWWDWHNFNDALKNYLTPDQFDQLRAMMYGVPPQADSVIGVVRQTTLSADDLAKIADASKYPKIMDSGALATYRSLKILDGGTPQYIDEVRNILKNSPEIAAQIVARHKSILDKVAVGAKLISSDEIKAILNHADMAPDDIVGMVKDADNISLIVNKLTNGTYTQALGNFLDSTKKYWDCINTNIGKTEADTWVRNNVDIAKKALNMPDADVAKMADIPHTTQEFAAKQDEIIADYCGGHPDFSVPEVEDLIFGTGRTAADEIVEVTQVFVDDVPSGWYTRSRNAVGDRFKKYWTAFGEMSRREKFMAMWWFWELCTFVVGFMMLKAFGLFPSDRSFRQWGHSEAIEKASWLCINACTDKSWEALSDAIPILEDAIINAETYLDDNEDALKREHSYDANKTAIDVGKETLKKMQECLINRGAEVAPGTGKIEFICVDKDQQPIISAAYVDGWKVGTVWASGLVIEEVDPATYDLKVYAGGYTGCEKTITLAAGGYEIFKCVMEVIGVCSPVSSVIISLTPKNPIKDEPVAFTGYATSEDPIETWEWDFGDETPKVTGQAVTHTYTKIGIFKTTLTATNDCGNSDSSDRMVTVTEEPIEESGTLLVNEPIDSVTSEKCAGSWTAEIYVGTTEENAQAIGKTTQFSIPFGTNEYIGGYGGQCGDHVIKVVLSDYDDASKPVTIDDGDSKSWQPVMSLHGAAVGTVKLTSNQTGFAGYVDGKFVGNSGTNNYLNVPNVAVGSQTVKIVKGEGYTPESCEDVVTVIDGGTVTYDCQMTPVIVPSHMIDIDVPVGSTLWVDGNVVT